MTTPPHRGRTASLEARQPPNPHLPSRNPSRVAWRRPARCRITLTGGVPPDPRRRRRRRRASRRRTRAARPCSRASRRSRTRTRPRRDGGRLRLPFNGDAIRTCHACHPLSTHLSHAAACDGARRLRAVTGASPILRRHVCQPSILSRTRTSHAASAPPSSNPSREPSRQPWPQYLRDDDVARREMIVHPRRDERSHRRHRRAAEPSPHDLPARAPASARRRHALFCVWFGSVRFGSVRRPPTSVRRRPPGGGCGRGSRVVGRVRARRFSRRRLTRGAGRARVPGFGASRKPRWRAVRVRIGCVAAPLDTWSSSRTARGQSPSFRVRNIWRFA